MTKRDIVRLPSKLSAGRKEGRRKEGRRNEGRRKEEEGPSHGAGSQNRFVCGIQVLSFGTIVNGNAMTSGVGHTVRSNGFGRAI